MSVLNQFHLQSPFSQLQDVLHSIHTTHDVLAFLLLVPQASSLLIDLSQSVRSRDNKYGTQIPYILVCKIFTYFNDIDTIRYGEWICYRWYQALNSPSRKHLIQPIKLPGKAFFLRSAQQGNAWAQAKLAECYQYGIGGIKVDEEEGKKWAQRSADQNDPEGQAALSYYYACGAKDLQQTFRLLQNSVCAGNARAKYYLAYYYKEGSGLENLGRALQLYTTAANQGYHRSQTFLGKVYLNGWLGVEKNLEESFRWTQLAALQGCPEAQYSLCMDYGDSMETEKDLQEAFRWCQLAAYSGHVAAQSQLGYLYDEGQGIERDAKLALHWYTVAAQQGSEIAQYNLGIWYEDLYRNEEALYWYGLAAAQGSKSAEKAILKLKSAEEAIKSGS